MMDRLDFITVLLIVLAWLVLSLAVLLTERLSKLRDGQTLIIEGLICGEPDENPEDDPAHPRDQSLG